MGDNICMFGKSASSGVEAMNCANKLARQKTAVDVLNGVVLLMKLEAECFQGYKNLALEREGTLTDKGLKLMEQCFTDIRVRDCQITVTPIEYGHRATVSKSSINAAIFTVVIPATGTFESRFGTCNCGKPAKDGIPCEHMVAVKYDWRIVPNSDNAILVDDCPLENPIRSRCRMQGRRRHFYYKGEIHP